MEYRGEVKREKEMDGCYHRLTKFQEELKREHYEPELEGWSEETEAGVK